MHWCRVMEERSYAGSNEYGIEENQTVLGVRKFGEAEYQQIVMWADSLIDQNQKTGAQALKTR